MIQNYVKPTIMIERFSLCQNIAAGCTTGNEWGSATFGDKTSCGWETPGGDIIWLEGTACNDPYGPDDEFNGVCFNNPGGGLTIFGS